jgi:NAD(P)-dependent dehydrogenase (short-subunit alcohol dehydrogenase family)
VILTDTAAVVTGGGSGIGAGIARALAERGCRIMLADIDIIAAEQAAEALRQDGAIARAVACNVSDYASVEALAEAAWSAFGPVQTIFNNAGVMSSAPVIDADPREVDWIIDTNLKGVWNGCSVFGKRFRAQGKPACIAITASEHSLGVPHLGGGIYTASKHAVLGMADVMRQELPDFINVSLTFPGMVRTRIYEATRSSPIGPAPEKVRAFGERAMAYGMDPLEVGRRAVEGVEAGEFMVMTHPHVRAIAEKRWNAVDAAFGRAPAIDNPGQYEVEAVMARLMAEKN